MIYMDRKTTTFIILLGLIIASSLFQGCIEGNTPALKPAQLLITLKEQLPSLHDDLKQYTKDKNKAEVAAAAPCTDNFDCEMEKGQTKIYIREVDGQINKTERKIKDLKKSIKAIEELQEHIKKQKEEIKEQNIEIRKSQNSAQGSSYALGQLSPNIKKQREIQNETKRQLAAAIKKIHALS